MPALNTVCIAKVNAPYMSPLYSVFMEMSATPLERLVTEARRRHWSDADLCRRLRVSAQRFNNWKQRGMPAQAAVDAAARLGLPLDYVFFGKGPRPEEGESVRQELTLYSITPDRQKTLLELFDQLTPVQQDSVIQEVRAYVDANLAVVKHFEGRKLQPTPNDRIEATFGLPALNKSKGSSGTS